MLGLGLTRYVLEVEPLAQASSADLIAAIAPNLDRYLSGDLRCQLAGFDSALGANPSIG